MSDLEAVDEALERYNAGLPSSIPSVEMITPIVAAQVQGIPNVAARASLIPAHLLQAATEESQTYRNPRPRQRP
ncbi:hypothetical protein Tco_0280049 [Tanacetum coccineum]